MRRSICVWAAPILHKFRNTLWAHDTDVIPPDCNRMKIFLAFFMFFQAAYVCACSCNLGSVQEKFQNSERVFFGKIESIKYLEEKNKSGDEKIIVQFSVSKSWKGGSDEVILNTAYNGISCQGYWFKESQEYLVYAYSQKGRLDTRYCGGVFQVEPKDMLQKEISELNAIIK